MLEIPTKDPDNGFIYLLNSHENNKSIVTGFIDGTNFNHIIGSWIEDDIKLHLSPNNKETSQENEEYSKWIFFLTKFHLNDFIIMLVIQIEMLECIKWI